METSDPKLVLLWLSMGLPLDVKRPECFEWRPIINESWVRWAVAEQRITPHEGDCFRIKPDGNQ